LNSSHEEVDQELVMDVTEEDILAHDHRTQAHADEELPEPPSPVLESLLLPDVLDLV